MKGLSRHHGTTFTSLLLGAVILLTSGCAAARHIASGTISIGKSVANTFIPSKVTSAGSKVASGIVDTTSSAVSSVVDTGMSAFESPPSFPGQEKKEKPKVEEKLPVVRVPYVDEQHLSNQQQIDRAREELNSRSKWQDRKPGVPVPDAPAAPAPPSNPVTTEAVVTVGSSPTLPVPTTSTEPSSATPTAETLPAPPSPFQPHTTGRAITYGAVSSAPQ